MTSSSSLSSYLPNDEDSFMLQVPASGSNLLLDEDDDFQFLQDNSGFGTPIVPAKTALTLEELTPKPAPLSPTRRLNSPLKQKKLAQMSPLKAALTRRKERDVDVRMESPARLDILKADLAEFSREVKMINGDGKAEEPPNEYLSLNKDEPQQRVPEHPSAEPSEPEPLPRQTVTPDVFDEEDSFMNSAAANRLLKYSEKYLPVAPPQSSHPFISTPIQEDESQSLVTSRLSEMEMERDNTPLTVSQLSPSKIKPINTTPGTNQPHASTSIPKSLKSAKGTILNEVNIATFSPMKPASKRAATPTRNGANVRNKVQKIVGSMLEELSVGEAPSSSQPAPQMDEMTIDSADVSPKLERATSRTISTSTHVPSSTTLRSRKVVALPTKAKKAFASSSRLRIFPKTGIPPPGNQISAGQTQSTQLPEDEQLGSNNVVIASTEQTPLRPPSTTNPDAEANQDKAQTLSIAFPSLVPANSDSSGVHVSAFCEPNARTIPEQALAKLVERCQDHAGAASASMDSVALVEPSTKPAVVIVDVDSSCGTVPVSTAATPPSSTVVLPPNTHPHPQTTVNADTKANMRPRIQPNSGSTLIKTSKQTAQRGLRDRVLGLSMRKRPVVRSGGVTKMRPKDHPSSERKPNLSGASSHPATAILQLERSHQELGLNMTGRDALSLPETLSGNDDAQLQAFETSGHPPRQLPASCSSKSDIGKQGQVRGARQGETETVGKEIDADVEESTTAPRLPRDEGIGNMEEGEIQESTRHAHVASTSRRRAAATSRKPASTSSITSSSSCLSSSRAASSITEGSSHSRSTSQSLRHIATLTKPIEFNFASDKRLEERRALHASSLAPPSLSSSSSSHIHRIPDFKSLHALNASLLASRREQYKAAPVIPVPFSSHLDERLKSRRAFDEQVRLRQEELEQEMAERKKEEDRQIEEEVREMRRRAIPKANEVPEWYKDAPKRKKD